MQRTMIALAIAATLVVSCTHDDVDNIELTAVVVGPSPAAITVGTTQTFSAQAVFRFGPVTDVTADSTWTSADTRVATMNGPVATGVALGTTTINARYQNVSGGATLTVK